jgi:hypothetical protein
MKTKKSKYKWQPATEAELQVIGEAVGITVLSSPMDGKQSDVEAMFLILNGEKIIALNSDLSLKRRIKAGLQMLGIAQKLRQGKGVALQFHH